MPHRPGVVLDEAVVAGGVGIAQFLPDPPLVVGPAANVAVAVAQQDHLGGRLDHAPVAEVVLVADRPAEGRLGAAPGPVDVHRADAAGDADLTDAKLADDRRVALMVEVALFALGILGGTVVTRFTAAEVHLFVRVPSRAEVGEKVGTPTRLDAGGEPFLDRVEPVLVVARVKLHGEAELLVVVEAADLVGHALGLGQGGQEQRGENRNNGDNHQQFDEGESPSLPMPGWLSCFHGALDQAACASRGSNDSTIPTGRQLPWRTILHRYLARPSSSGWPNWSLFAGEHRPLPAS